MAYKQEITPFSIQHLQRDVDKAAEEIIPWVKLQVRPKIASFRLDDQQVDDICGRIVSGIRQKAKVNSLAFENYAKLQSYVAVAARRLAIRARKKAQREIELNQTEQEGDQDLIRMGVARAQAEETARETEKILNHLEEWIAHRLTARDLLIFQMTRQGATGREMSAALGITRNAVYQAKDRLKKKCAPVAAKFSDFDDLANGK